jgi:murein DD-endopeptidase MepM/ murein hydrolase activator NlpD
MNFLKKSLRIVLFILLIGVSAGMVFSNLDKENEEVDVNENEVKAEVIEPTERKEILKIEEGDTYGKLMEEGGFSLSEANKIYDKAFEKYDLVKVRAGKEIEIFYDFKTDDFKRFVYKIDSEQEIIVSYDADSEEWVSELKPIDYEIKVVVKEAVVETSMYEAALENDIDVRAIIELANAFQWTIDFAMDPRVGDDFKFVYEERYLDGEYKMPGRILAAYYVNDGEKYEVYYFEENEDNKGYFDKDGNSVQKMFLKAPVAFKYISSGFTTGLRYIEAFNVSTGHRAIDYAAQSGTPIRSVGDGSVIFAAYDGPYGYTVRVRHNSTYTTSYSHMSKFAVKRGNKVKQGDVIGYVGSTGFSTGPHLHYEMVKNGVKINPLREVLPPGEPIKEENKERFFSEIEKWKSMF